MNYVVKISDDVYWDLVDGIDYYKNISSENLSNKFRDDFRFSLKKVRENPIAFAVKYKSIRSTNFSNFPYQIHYYIQQNFIYIIGVFHAKSNPKNWEKRL